MCKGKIMCAFLVMAMALGTSIAESEENNLHEGNNTFAMDLYSKLSTADGNIFFSPYSISTALAMTYVGARGETAIQMRDTLHFRLPVDELPGAFAAFEKSLHRSQREGGYELSVANSIWGQSGYTFLEEFLNTLENSFKAPLRTVNFRREAELARQKINTWVADKTNDRIQDLIGPGALTPLTRLVLCNAIYFKGDWASQFDEDNTETKPFRTASGEEVEIPLMNQKIECLYGENDDLQLLQLPYVGNDISMLVILPKKPGTLEEIEAQLDYGKLKSITRYMHRREVDVFLPRFKLETEFSLGGTLADMGMPNAFGGAADFSGMDGTKELLISAVLHKAFVEVNEEGTEAAAATAVVMRLTSVMPQVPVSFKADHPFIFMIRDNDTGAILFMGRILDPSC